MSKKSGPQSIGKTRGGTNTKIHAIVANEKALIAFHLSRGNLHDGPQGRLLIEHLDQEYENSYVLMDKAYEGAQTRQAVLDKGMIPVVPPKTNRKNQWEYDKTLYRRRNEVERFFRRLKYSRRIFTRYDKLDTTYNAFIQLALIGEYFRNSVNTP